MIRRAGPSYGDVSQKPYLLLTGLPRAGTTLTASLVDRLENALCLNEPPRYYDWAAQSKDRTEYAARCLADLEEMFASLLSGGMVPDRREKDGSVPHNYFDRTGRRTLDFAPIGRPGCKGELLLAVKHNEPFTAALRELSNLEKARIVAVVRRPLPTILSWQSRPIPLSNGNLSVGYSLWPEAQAIRAAAESVEDMQAQIFELYCSRYWEFRDRIAVIKYEDIVANPLVLERLTGRRLIGEPALATQNGKLSSLRSAEQLTRLRRTMTKHFKNVYRFYPDPGAW